MPAKSVFARLADAQDGWRAAVAALRRVADSHAGRWSGMEPRDAIRDAAARLDQELPALNPNGIISITYKNHRGEIAKRRIRFIDLRYGTSDYYPTPGWLLVAWDLDRKAEREFALTGLQPPQDEG